MSKSIFIALVLPLLAGCLSLEPTGDEDAGSTSTSTTTTTTTTGGTAATGSDCAQDPASGATLCSSISLCSGLAIDHTQFPDCGFRVNGTALDVECTCGGGTLCPLGAPQTCSEVTQLLLDQTEDTICEGANEGKCTMSDAGTTTTTSSSCDKQCEMGCEGSATCIQLCGC